MHYDYVDEHMSDQDLRKARQASRMKRDWDMRARQDALSFIASRRQPWALEEFFKQGRQVAHTLTRDNFKELAFDPTGKRMLEIGCGIGRLFPGFADMFAEVWGVDVSEEMIDQGAKLNPSPNVRFVQNSGYDLGDIPDSYFDFVFSYITFQHVPQKWMVLNYLAETYRTLKCGGAFQLHFRTPYTGLKHSVYHHIPRHLRRPVQILYELLLFRPLRGPAYVHHRVAGDIASWHGTGFYRAEIERELLRLGFIQVRTLDDKTHSGGRRFWAIGRKPDTMAEREQTASAKLEDRDRLDAGLELTK